MKDGKHTRRRARWLSLALLVALLPLASGCVTVAEFRKLERQVRDMQRGGGGGGGGAEGSRIADLSAQIDGLRDEIQRLEGRLEVSEHRVDAAMKEARAARAEASAASSPGQPGAGGAPEEPEEEAEPSEGGGEAPASAGAGEVEAYRAAYDAWRQEDSETCIDRFRNFLQTYPASAHADDAAYWLADCYFKQGDYKTAVLRFDDVVSRYPKGSKAADALYRQGEALLRLGPGYGKAAGKAFERVLTEYPDSGRATEAKRQLDLLGSG
jgi:tol-pal system protein YbgF